MRHLVDERAREVLGSGMATAATVAVTDRDRTLIARSDGVADDVLWPIASVGEAFAAVIALQLAEEGALDLHAPVEGSLPWFSVRGRYAPITLHHLLTHTSWVIVENSDRAPASGYDVRARGYGDRVRAGRARAPVEHRLPRRRRRARTGAETGTTWPSGSCVPAARALGPRRPGGRRGRRIVRYCPPRPSPWSRRRLSSR